MHASTSTTEGPALTVTTDTPTAGTTTDAPFADTAPGTTDGPAPACDIVDHPGERIDIHHWDYSTGFRCCAD